MSYVALDTDVTSRPTPSSTKELPAPIVEAILHNRCASPSSPWPNSPSGPSAATYQRRLDDWLSNVLVLPYSNEIEDVRDFAEYEGLTPIDS